VLDLVLATSNPGKLREFLRLFQELLPEMPVNLALGRDVGLRDVTEDGSSFAENARIKAMGAASQCGRICLAEDSGIEVDFLGGAPGIMSHRFSESGADEDNNRLLLQRLEGVIAPLRTARYRSAICIASPRGIIVEGEGTVEGLIAVTPSGQNGFGYDPLFYSTELHKTMGDASAREKDSVSHRRRAMEEIVKKIRNAMVLGEGSF